MAGGVQHFDRAVPGARGSSLSLLPPGLRVFGVVVVVAAVFFLQTAVGEVSADGKTPAVEDVRCGCGADLSWKLAVEKTADKDCTGGKLRRPRELRGKGENQYPLRAKGRRTPEGSEVHLSWRFSYMSRKKRSRLSEFHILFVAKTTKRRGQRTENGQCFKISGLKKGCKGRVICKALYPYTRTAPRRLAVQVLYQYSGGKKKRPIDSGKERAVYVLASSLTSRRKRRGKQTRKHAARKAKRTRQQNDEQKVKALQFANCSKWIPTVTLAAEGDHVTVKITPVNPFASELELALHHGGSSLQINPTRIPAKMESYTFTNVSRGTYRVSMRYLGPKCSRARYFYSRASVNVTDTSADGDPEEDLGRTKRHKHLTHCPAWRPKVTLSSSGRSVTFHYSPDNPLATSFEIALQKPGSSLMLHQTKITKNVRRYTFENVEEGDYRLTIRALGPQCRGARYYFSRDFVSVKDVEPICSHWKPSFKAVRIDHGSWCLIEVDIDTPTNIAADKIVVALLEIPIDSENPHDRKIVQQKFLGVHENRTVFNLTTGDGKIYKALVKPDGCRDCRDFRDYREACFLPFEAGDIISVTYNKSMQVAQLISSNTMYPPGSTPGEVRIIHRPDSNRNNHNDQQYFANTYRGGNYHSANSNNHGNEHSGRWYFANSYRGNSQRRQATSDDSPAHAGPRRRRRCDICCRRCACYDIDAVSR